MPREIEADFEDGTSVVRAEANALEAITRSEVSMQIEAAHRWPRSVTKFLRAATELATYNEEVAESCIYSVPRAGKMIEGKSIRLAEMCASAWGNLHIGARVLDEDNETSPVIVGQAVVWDLERNVRITIEAQRGVLKSNGKRYDPDMVRTTGMAAISIAYRNAVFRVIPQAYANAVYAEARKTAIGDATTLSARREKWLAWMAKAGVTPDRVFARLGVVGIDDVNLEHIGTLIGLANAIKSGELAVDTAFPAVILPPAATAAVPAQAPTSSPAAPPAPAPEGRRVAVGTGKRGRASAAAAAPAPAASSAPPAPAAAPAPAPAPAASSPAPAPAPAPAAPPAPPPVDLLELMGALESVDPDWRDGDMATLEGWTEEQRRAALTWADGVLNNRGTMAEQLARPPHTVLAQRQPGED